MKHSKTMEYKIANMLGACKKSFEGSASNPEAPIHLWLCQCVAYELKKKNSLMNSYTFGKKCGYNFNLLG